MNPRYERYDGWAALYNATMGPDYGREQFAALERLLLPNLPKRAAILDLCCGTGQLLAPLCEAGYMVTGLDGSTEMLRFAKDNAPSAKLVAEDARTFANPAAFDAVVSTSASLNHISCIADLRSVFENVNLSLRAGGHFLFDLNHPSQLERWWNGRPTEGEISRRQAWMITPEYDAQTSVGKFTVTIHTAPDSQQGSWRAPLYRLLSLPRFIGLRLSAIDRLDRIEPTWHQETLEFPVYGYPVDEVSAQLFEAGFESVRVETLDGRPLNENRAAHFLCQKPGGASL